MGMIEELINEIIDSKYDGDVLKENLPSIGRLLSKRVLRNFTSKLVSDERKITNLADHIEGKFIELLHTPGLLAELLFIIEYDARNAGVTGVIVALTRIVVSAIVALHKEKNIPYKYQED